MKAEVPQREGEKEPDHEHEMAMAGKSREKDAALLDWQSSKLKPEEQRINLS